MSPDERRTIEVKAERLVRRGDLGEALRTLETLLEAFPGDARLGQWMREIRESLQPTELFRRPPPGPAAPRASLDALDAPAAPASAPADPTRGREAALTDILERITTRRRR